MLCTCGKPKAKLLTLSQPCIAQQQPCFKICFFVTATNGASVCMRVCVLCGCTILNTTTWTISTHTSCEETRAVQQHYNSKSTRGTTPATSTYCTSRLIYIRTIGTLVFPLFNLRHPGISGPTTSRRGTLYHYTSTTKRAQHPHLTTAYHRIKSLYHLNSSFTAERLPLQRQTRYCYGMFMVCCYVMLCDVSYVMLCYVMLCLLCYVMLRYAMLCYATPYVSLQLQRMQRCPTPKTFTQQHSKQTLKHDGCLNQGFIVLVNRKHIYSLVFSVLYASIHQVPLATVNTRC